MRPYIRLVIFRSVRLPKRVLPLLGLVCSIVTLSLGHPLGNFSVNQFSRLNVERDRIIIKSFLDMAEIPTFQATQDIDTDGDSVLSQPELEIYLDRVTPAYVANLKLAVDNSPLSLVQASKRISLLSGAGGLNTLRLEWEFRSDNPLDADVQHHLRFENGNNVNRLGWNEVVITRSPDLNIYDSDRYGTSLSDELRSYPDQMLSVPLNERTAELSFSQASIPEGSIALRNRDGTTSAAERKDKLAQLIAVPEITPGIMLIGVFVALGLGAIHAMSPGHGKTVVGAYLVGSKGTLKHAAFLGLTVTITHTIGVFAIGLITMLASRFILPERIMPFLSFVSGLLVLTIGLSLFKSRLLNLLGYTSDTHHHNHDLVDDETPHSHSHGANDHSGGSLVHTHDGHTHSHAPPAVLTWRSLLSLGISGGLLPCPSALILMLSAISLNRIGYGFMLTVAFSVGLAATLMCVGIAFLYIGKLLDRPGISDNPVVRALPVFSALVIACVGAIICYQSVI